MKMRLDGWLTNKGDFFKEQFNHKETLAQNGYKLDSSDSAIRAGFSRLVDDGDVLHVEVWFTHYRVAKEWLERNAADRDVELTVLNYSTARVFRVNGRI